MMHWAIYFADFTSALKEMTGGRSVSERFSSRDAFTVVGASVLVGLVLVIWISIHYRRRAERDGSRRVLTDRPVASRGANGERRRRRRRRPHRPRNPSLQQTGGLPPPRPEDLPPKY